MLRPCSAAVGPVLSTILVVPACYGLSMAVGSSNYIEIGRSSNWLGTDRGTSLNVGVSTRGRSRCHGSGEGVARGGGDRNRRRFEKPHRRHRKVDAVRGSERDLRGIGPRGPADRGGVRGFPAGGG